MTRRRRIRASDIASPNPRKGLLAMMLIGIALTLILLFKGSFGDSTAGFMDQLTHDPDLDLPESALERGTVPSTLPAPGPKEGAPASGAPASGASASGVSAAPVSTDRATPASAGTPGAPAPMSPKSPVTAAAPASMESGGVRPVEPGPTRAAPSPGKTPVMGGAVDANDTRAARAAGLPANPASTGLVKPPAGVVVPAPAAAATAASASSGSIAPVEPPNAAAASEGAGAAPVSAPPAEAESAASAGATP